MRPLDNKLHERFAWLIAEGETATAAYRQLRPGAKQPKVLGSRIWARSDVRVRVAEIREQVNDRAIMRIEQKRDLLRQMIEGTLPTKVNRTAKGQVEFVFDRLAALMLDCKIAGDFAAEKPGNAPEPFSLKFEMYHRDDQNAPERWLKAEPIT
jgi:hypothetical protein